jgi:hypothetical protein
MENEKEHSLCIEYALTRSEIFRSYLRSLAESPRFRRTIIIYSVAFGIFDLILRVILERSFTVRDIISAAAWAVGLFVFLPLWIFIRGKTTKRTLTISQDGISTEIGRYKGQIPWNKISIVTEAPRFILIARTNGNAFFIPGRAFSGVEHRQHFLTEMKGWIKADS